jgi:cobalt-zinc-cadmium efflux system membrane fusion protein
MSTFNKFLMVGIVAVALIVGWMARSNTETQAAQRPVGSKSTPEQAKSVVSLGENPDTLRFASDEAMKSLGVRVAEVKSAPSLLPLRLPGSLFLDPNRLVRVHSRFSGEAVSIGKTEGEGSRTLRYGDRVKRGQVLAVIWSKEVGEKKSEYVEALSRLEVNKSLLKRLEALEKGVVSEKQIFESRRTVQSDMIAVSRAERTLRSWRLTDEEIESLKREVSLVQERNGHNGATEVSLKWAETEVRAAIDGVIVEKNFNVGDIVEAQEDLFKVADLSRMQVLIDVYEEDIPALRALPPEERNWKIALKSEETGAPRVGKFELIGNVIDPTQRTGVIMGWIDNSDGRLAVGQFITATIDLPPPVGVVAIPDRALIEEGDLSAVFVESNPGKFEFTRRKVSVVRRGSEMVLVKMSPDAGETKRGIQPLKVGERVVISGVLQLGGELLNLQSLAASK